MRSIILSFTPIVWGLENGIARTPPMGWLAWERFMCETDCEKFPDTCVSKKLFMQIADSMVEKGLREAGYKYLNIDDCWSEKERDENRELHAHAGRFGGDEGMKELGEYIHSKGLLFGLYTDIGTATCQEYPGLAELDLTLGDTMKRDLAKFAEFGFDALKVDGCNDKLSHMREQYVALGNALKEVEERTGRKILYSCSWPAYTKDHCENEHDIKQLQDTCNLWRNYIDVFDDWHSIRTIMEHWAKPKDHVLVTAAGPGHWNDPDMLMVGNAGVSLSEQRTQFALWAILAAPLYLSADLRTIEPEALEIALNRDIIAVNQDEDGKQGYVIFNEVEGPRRIWVRELSNSKNGHVRRAVLFENKHTFGNIIEMEIADFSTLVPPGTERIFPYLVENLYKRQLDPNHGVHKAGEPFKVRVDESSSEMYLFTFGLSDEEAQHISEVSTQTGTLVYQETSVVTIHEVPL
jgi:alpha-N-acetylgalactosaminidase